MCIKSGSFTAGGAVRVCERDEAMRWMGSFVTVHVKYCILVCVRLVLDGNMQVGDPRELGGVGVGVDGGRDVGVANEEAGGGVGRAWCRDTNGDAHSVAIWVVPGIFLLQEGPRCGVTDEDANLGLSCVEGGRGDGAG